MCCGLTNRIYSFSPWENLPFPPLVCISLLSVYLTSFILLVCSHSLSLMYRHLPQLGRCSRMMRYYRDEEWQRMASQGRLFYITSTPSQKSDTDLLSTEGKYLLLLKKGFSISRQTYLPTSLVPTKTPWTFCKPEKIQPPLTILYVSFVY